MRHATRTIPIAAILSFALALGGPAALAETAARREAGPVRIGPVTGDPEKDSIGFPVAEQRHLQPQPACAVVRYTAEAVPVGPVTGDPEKDSIGFIRLADRDGCDGGMEAAAAPR